MIVKAAPDNLLVSCHHLSCAYGDNVVVNDVTFTVERGEFVGIVGPSGSGKTTLLRAILGMVKPVHGEVGTVKGVRLGYVP